MSTTVTDANFDKDVLGASGPVVVDFWAEWCGPCKLISPALEEISTEMDGKVTIAKLNVDDNPNITIRYGVRSIPTLIVFKNGEPVSMQVGAAPKGRLSTGSRARSSFSTPVSSPALSSPRRSRGPAPTLRIFGRLRWIRAFAGMTLRRNSIP